MKRSLFASILLLALLAGSAASQSIGIFGDAVGSSCKIPVTPGGVGTAYIVLVPGGEAPQSTGVDFAVTGWPGWAAIAAPNPISSIVLGDPLAPLGCGVRFQSCLGPSPIVLFTITFTAPASPPIDIPLQVVAFPAQSCPRSFLCDAPTFTPKCVTGLRSWLNPSGWQAPELLSPVDGAIEQPTTGVVLHWNWSVPPGESCTLAAYDPIVYFGTDADPPLVGAANLTQFTHATGPLSPDTTYYWRIFINGGGVSSPVWHFRTETLVGTESARWQQVKQLFR